jgi:hypothetical protein
MCRRRFSLSAVASSDGTHIRISHDRRANTTGRRVKNIFAKCGDIKLMVTERQAMMLAPCQRIARL